MDDERETSKADLQKTQFWVDSVVSVPRNFLRETSYPEAEGKAIFPTPASRKERELIGALIDNIAMLQVSRDVAEEKLREIEKAIERNPDDVQLKIDKALQEAILNMHPRLVGIGGIASAEFVKGQEELKNKGLAELSRRKLGELYQYAKIKEMENE
ncbi:MAG: hypothetical protein QXU98_12230 [Candidatus Parvarchaeota archaeon]